MSWGTSWLRSWGNSWKERQQPVESPPVVISGGPYANANRSGAMYSYSREDTLAKIKEADEKILAATIKREDEELIAIFQCLLTAYKN